MYCNCNWNDVFVNGTNPEVRVPLVTRVLPLEAVFGKITIYLPVENVQLYSTRILMFFQRTVIFFRVSEVLIE